MKSSRETEVEQLAQNLRNRIISVTTKNGGHLGSSLGAVELIIALHNCFDLARDRLIFDVGHQAYAHKILSGRDAEFATLRQYGGLSGFPKRAESVFDAHDAGHASDALSIAEGYALARDLNGGSESIIALVGDAALSGGMTFEALNHIGQLGLKIILILNDNGMSISKTAGAFALHLGSLRAKRPYMNLKKVAKQLQASNRAGEVVATTLSNFKNSIKDFFLQDHIFEDLGWTYIGTIDGHKVADIEAALEIAQKFDGPVVIHALTQKGKGHIQAENCPDNLHGVSPRQCQSEGAPCAQLPSFTEVFSEAMINTASQNYDIVGITAAMSSGTGLEAFADQFPLRCFDVGIAEEHAVGMAAGLALAGKRPVVAIYSSFLQRAFDQIVVDVALQELPVIFAIDRAGLVGADGPTHHGAFDISYLSLVPNLSIYTPYDQASFQRCFDAAIANTSGPVAIRYPRGAIVAPFSSANLATAANLKSKQALPSVCILAVGDMVALASDICDLANSAVKPKLNCRLIAVEQVKPLNLEQFKLTLKSDLIVTLENGVLSGGFGQAVLNHFNSQDIENLPRILNFGLPDQFIEGGEVETLREQIGLTAPQILGSIKQSL